MENPNSDAELYQVLTPDYFADLARSAEAQKARLSKAKAALEPGDMLHANIEFLDEHLDGLIVQWKADSEAARHWR